MTTTNQVDIDLIEIGDRHRRDLGNVQALADSIAELGLMHPIVVTTERRLVAGRRRLEACRLLGWQEVPVTVADSITSAVALLQAERDENGCRKDPTVTEKVALADALIEIERPAAAERTGGRPPKGNPETPEKFSEVSSSGEAKARAAAGAGMSRPTYEKAKALVEAARCETAPEALRQVAQEAVAEMDRTGKVDGAHRKVLAAQEAAGDALIASLTSEESNAALERARLSHDFHRLDLQHRRGLLQLDPELVALVLPDDRDWELVERLAEMSRAWFERLLAARPKHMQLIEGGNANGNAI